MALPSDRATHEQSPQAVSAVPVGIPSAMIRDLRAAAKDLDYEAQALRRDARDLELRAATKYDAFIHFDMLADKLEKQLAQAIEAGTAETGTGSACESAVGETDAPQTPPVASSPSGLTQPPESADASSGNGEQAK